MSPFPIDKDSDEMIQSSAEAEHCIKGLTVENEIVLDPMMGTGTTGIAAISLGRQFIGIDNSDRFDRADANIRMAKANICSVGS
jgi:adenine specific DNA methylase Mod